MTERSYRQYCPIANALDLVGDRWALLVVRDLFLGPKRFTDLRVGLPGIGTNVLTDRLKGLERAGVIRRHVLPPPAASTVYELTSYGRELEEPMVALARWGEGSLGTRRAERSVSAESVMLALRAAFAPVAQAGTSGFYEARFDEPSFGRAFGVRIGAGAIEVTREPPVAADARVRIDVETLYAVANGRESWRRAAERGAVRVDGDAELEAALLGAPGVDVE